MANKTTIQAFTGNAGAFTEEHAKKIRLYVEMPVATFWQQKLRQPQKCHTISRKISHILHTKHCQKPRKRYNQIREGGRTVGSGRVATIIE